MNNTYTKPQPPSPLAHTSTYFHERPPTAARQPCGRRCTTPTPVGWPAANPPSCPSSRCPFAPPGNATSSAAGPHFQAHQPPSRAHRAGALARLEKPHPPLDGLTSRHTNPHGLVPIEQVDPGTNKVGEGATQGEGCFWVRERRRGRGGRAGGSVVSG